MYIHIYNIPLFVNPYYSILVTTTLDLLVSRYIWLLTYQPFSTNYGEFQRGVRTRSLLHVVRTVIHSARNRLNMIRSFDGVVPEIAESAYVDESAVVIGDVVLEAETSVWPGAVLRGDHGKIVLREGANVQDNATLHEGTEIGARTTVGHNAIVHAAKTSERSLVGMGAIVLDNATVGEEAIVAANSVVTEGTEVPARTLVAGVPAEPVKELKDTGFAAAADRYIENARVHAERSEVVERGTIRPTEHE